VGIVGERREGVITVLRSLRAKILFSVIIVVVVIEGLRRTGEGERG
jgi:hypothetical protein